MYLLPPLGARSRRVFQTMPNMVEDASTAQARQMLGSLEAYLVQISGKLERVEAQDDLRDRRVSTRGATLHRRQRADLRREFYEAHRLIDGIHRRFPQTCDRHTSTGRVVAPQQVVERERRHTQS
jgi:hypothetical protein